MTAINRTKRMMLPEVIRLIEQRANIVFVDEAYFTSN
jgi:hypothetical protein